MIEEFQRTGNESNVFGIKIVWVNERIVMQYEPMFVAMEE